MAEVTPFQRSLAANRSRLNAKFAAARAHSALDGAVVLEHLAATIGPIVDAVAAVRPESADSVLDALFDLSLELIQEGVLGPGARRPVVTEGWRMLLPALPIHLAAAPRRIAGALTNALYNLAGTPGARPAAWLATLRDVGPDCGDAATLLKLGQIAGWLAGLAHYRAAGLALCRELAPALVRRVLGLEQPLSLRGPSLGPKQSLASGEIASSQKTLLAMTSQQALSAQPDPSLSALLDRMAADPWLIPQAAALARPAWEPRLKLAARVGAFRGFGGDFLAPPAVAWAQGQFYVQDGETWWLLSADAFGATLLRADPPAKGPGRPPESPFRVGQRGEVTCGRQSAAFAELAAVKSWAADATTLAVTSPLSHAVHLFAVM